MRDYGSGEIHYLDEDGNPAVEVVQHFDMLVRGREESVVDFKERVTNHVLLHGKAYRRCNLVEVKWAGPLGYSQGYIPIPASHLIKRQELPKL